MKFATKTILCVLSLVVNSLSKDIYDYHKLKLNEFGVWLNMYNKNYNTNKEFAIRYITYMFNSRFINNHNANSNNTFKLGHNQFSDMTHEEYLARLKKSFKTNAQENYVNIHQDSYQDYDSDLYFQTINETVDWRTHGCVTPVKDQGQCGSCWAFSTVVAMEGSYALKHNTCNNNIIMFSEQQAVDCSSGFGNFGCNGGYPIWLYNYYLNGSSVETEEAYPYHAVDQTCNYTKGVANVNSYVNITSGSEDDLVLKSNLAPLSVCIDASSMTFQFYKSGVYTDTTCGNTMNDLDHCVGLVGYGMDASEQKYYIVKNSWGTSWGDSGYIYMARDKNNMCGISTLATLVHMD